MESYECTAYIGMGYSNASSHVICYATFLSLSRLKVKSIIAEIQIFRAYNENAERHSANRVGGRLSLADRLTPASSVKSASILHSHPTMAVQDRSTAVHRSVARHQAAPQSLVSRASPAR